MMGNPRENTIGWFRENNVDLLDWPSQSPDLNPNEHLWHELERKLGNRNFKGQPAAMWTALQEAWTKISPDYIIKLIDSMPNRCEAVINPVAFQQNIDLFLFAFVVCFSGNLNLCTNSFDHLK